MPWRSGSGRRGGRRGGRSGGLSRRRPKEWQSAELLGGTDVIAIGECVAYPLITSLEFDAEYTDSTLARVRGLVHVSPANNPTVSVQETAYGAIGIIELEGQDDVTGTVEPWCPLFDSDASWLWHNYFTVRRTNGSNGAPDILDFQEHVDSAAMRKLEAGDSSLYLVIENDVSSDNFVEFWFGTRFIISEK